MTCVKAPSLDRNDTVGLLDPTLRSIVSAAWTPGPTSIRVTPRGMEMSTRTRWISRVLLAIGVLAGSGAASVSAQGVTTGSITGTVTDEMGQAIEAAQIQVVN